MITDVKNIVVLLEFEDGAVRQVLTTKFQKEIALKLLESEDGKLKVSEEIEPLTFQFKPK